MCTKFQNTETLKKTTSTSLQLACLHLNINIYQGLIAEYLVLIHLHSFFLSALALLNARKILKPFTCVAEV